MKRTIFILCLTAVILTTGVVLQQQEPPTTESTPIDKITDYNSFITAETRENPTYNELVTHTGVVIVYNSRHKKLNTL